jgi:hypothetical protein
MDLVVSLHEFEIGKFQNRVILPQMGYEMNHFVSDKIKTSP